MISIEVTKNNNENPVSLIRRFSRKVRGSNILKNARGKRFFSRPDSKFKLKSRALKTIERAAHYAHLKKMGKLPDR